MDEKLINDIVWWIPFKKIRNFVKSYLIEINEIYTRVHNIENFIDYKFKNLNSNIKKLTPKTHIDFIEIHLAENCNLNCYSCTHFSQLAKEEYYNIDIFERDLQRLYEITNGLINKIHLMGGEPLLNNNCKKYFYITRKYFKNSEIFLITNGILLPKQDEDFWISCKENDIEIRPTKYPIKIDWEYIKNISNKYGVSLYFYNDENIEKQSRKNIFDLSGKMDSFNSFIKCNLATNCIALHNGKIYPCGVASNIRHFNNYFNQKLEITERDYIDIYKTKDYSEILEFLAKPIPFCRYCNTDKWNTFINWTTSKKIIDEYIDRPDQTRPDQTRPDQTRPDGFLLHNFLRRKNDKRRKY